MIDIILDTECGALTPSTQKLCGIQVGLMDLV